VDRAIAGIHDAPAALGADFANGCARVRHLVAGPDRMRHLVEAIRCSDGTDPDRFEQNIVAGISTHQECFSVACVKTRWGGECIISFFRTLPPQC